MHELNLYVDESGNLGKGMGRYFLICALEIENNLKKKITRKAARTQINFKKNKCINEEIKGYNLKHILLPLGIRRNQSSLRRTQRQEKR